MKQVWSCGGGRQSCAIACLIINGKLALPDIAVISNTGRERFTTFPYLHKWVIPALAEKGVTLHIIQAAEWSYYGTRYVDGSGDLMLPAYHYDDDGKKVKNTPDCSGAWKRDSINRWLSKVHGITRSKYCKWIGYSSSPKEIVRALRMGRSKKEGGKKSRFPLIELGLTTEACLEIVARQGWDEPKVSTCWMCPNLKDEEIAELSPEERTLSIDFDEEMRRQFPATYLHRSFQPLAKVVLNPSDKAPEPCDSGHCFV